MTSGGGGSPKTSFRWAMAEEARRARPGPLKSTFQDTILGNLPLRKPPWSEIDLKGRQLCVIGLQMEGIRS